MNQRVQRGISPMDISLLMSDRIPAPLTEDRPSKLFKFSSSKFNLTAALFMVLMKVCSNVVKANINIPTSKSITQVVKNSVKILQLI